MDEAKLLEYAALAECASSHPISKSLQRAYGKAHRPQPCDRHPRRFSGHGVTGQSGRRSRGRRQQQAHGAAGHPLPRLPQCGHHHPHGGGRPVRRSYRDLRRGEAPRQGGHRRTAQAPAWTRPSCSPATRKRVAEAVAAELGVDEVRSELLPADKVSKVEELLGQQRGKAQAGLRGRRHQRRPRAEPR